MSAPAQRRLPVMTARVTVRVAADRVDDVADDVLARLAAGDDVLVELVAGASVELSALDALARLVLAARRRTGDLQLRPACGDLRRLAVLTGFCAALPFDVGPFDVGPFDVGPFEPSGQAWREAEPLEGPAAELLQEVVDVPDPPG